MYPADRKTYFQNGAGNLERQQPVARESDRNEEHFWCLSASLEGPFALLLRVYAIKGNPLRLIL
jgi:hypothetical protein